jgi:hypothetical protein
MTTRPGAVAVRAVTWPLVAPGNPLPHVAAHWPPPLEVLEALEVLDPPLLDVPLLLVVAGAPVLDAVRDVDAAPLPVAEEPAPPVPPAPARW